MNARRLESDILRLAALPADAQSREGREVFAAFVAALEAGEIRAAEREEASGEWRTHSWVKEGVLLGFRIGSIVPLPPAGPFQYSDKDTYPVRSIDGPGRSVRVVPGGTSIRAGAYVGRHVTIMPPAYVNVAAWIGDGTLIDSHALVGSCAQVGERVHVSAAAQVGGVLEPVGALPVVIEDDVFVGGNCGVYEGTIVRERAVLAAGVILTGGTPVHDLVHETVYRRTADEPLIIPEGAVVVPGTRPARGDYAARHGLGLAVPVIVKYRDEKSDAATTLEDALR